MYHNILNRSERRRAMIRFAAMMEMWMCMSEDMCMVKRAHSS